MNKLSCFVILIAFGQAFAQQAAPAPLIPRLVGDWWIVAGDPDLGPLTHPAQQPVDFGIWQTADGSWQIWSCIRGTKEPGKTRLFHRWEGAKLTDTEWRPMGIAMQADPALGETQGGLQAPYVVQHDGKYWMFYGDWASICLATSVDGKAFTRFRNAEGKPQLDFAGRIDRNRNTRDPMVRRANGKWFCYYTAHPGNKGFDYARTSDDLLHWSEERVVAARGRSGDGPYSAECPFVVEPQPGNFYLFRTQRYGKEAQTMVYYSTDPLDFGIDNDAEHYLATLPVAAPEVFQHEGQWYMAALLPSLKGIQITRLEWARQAGYDTPPVKAFPTAEGFGADAVGGRGGRVIEVTTLEDSGEGSLRAAMEADGPRICVFRVSGTITLKDAIRVHTPYLTVAGQSSPGGIEIRGAGQPEGDWGVWFVNGAHDIVIRHLRVRMGGNMKHDAGNNLLFYGTAEPGVRDVMVDHCSVSWGSDTQLDWYGSFLDRATFQWNIIGECFMGQHIGGNRAPKHLTLHHNLYANLGSRTPLMQHANVFDFRNNVIYNWSGNNASVFGQFALNTSAFGNVVNNLWLAGPESGHPYLNVGNGGPVRIDGSRAQDGGTKLYLAGNWGPRSPTGSENDWSGHGVNTWDYYELNHDGSTHLVEQAQYAATEPFPAPPVTADRLSNLLEKVLATAGAYKPTRDAIDQRIVKSVRDKAGSSRISTMGPWPDLATGAPAPPLDSDHDGMPDAWETAHGLNPGDWRDGAAVARNGYTNLENYLNELAGDPIP